MQYLNVNWSIYKENSALREILFIFNRSGLNYLKDYCN